MNKEKCEMALNWLKGAICTECPRKYPIGFSKCIEEFSNTLKQLIEEHFELVDAMNHFSDEVMEYIEENRRLRENLDILRINPPLKFEELKAGMWVWDNKYDEYIQINFVTPRKEIEVYIPSYIDGDFQGIYVEEFKFEENRYYRKQVEEC